MIRTCPTCRDFYADDSLLFCLADGTPLVTVAPDSELWSGAQKVVEEKERVLNRERRRVKWRRIALTSITTMIVMAVIFVVTVNGIIYLNHQTEDESARAEASEPATPETPGVDIPQRRPPAWQRPTPTSTPITKPTPSPTPTPTPTCAEADKRREREAIVKSFGEIWRRRIEGERQRVIAENSPTGSQGVEATLSPLEYASSFFEGCRAASVTVRYSWHLSTSYNGTARVVTVPKERKFACTKTGGAWQCR
jgi:predicted nucleic acid-binding Zn ribbon protein